VRVLQLLGAFFVWITKHKSLFWSRRIVHRFPGALNLVRHLSKQINLKLPFLRIILK